MSMRPFENDPNIHPREVPVRGRPAGVVLLRGEGLPDRVGIGVADLPTETWLNIENRNLTGPLYQSVQPIRLGIVALAGTATKGSMTMDGHTVGEGSAVAEKVGGEISIAQDDEADIVTAAWLGQKEDGTAFIVVAHREWDSFQIRGALAPHIAGGFHLQSLYAGSYQAAPELGAFGWSLVLQKERAPEPIRAPQV